jgi:hypothetical protein
VGNAIQLAAQNTLDDDRDTTLTEDIVNALNELADSNDLMGSEKEHQTLNLPHPYNLLGMALRTKPKRPTCATSSPFSKSS